MEKTVAGSYKNNIKMLDLSFKALDQLNDSIEYGYITRLWRSFPKLLH